jgi:hypothetical protein
MTDRNGNPCWYRCPHPGRMVDPQTPVKRDTMPVTLVGQYEVLRQLRIQHNDRKDSDHDAGPAHPID